MDLMHAMSKGRFTKVEPCYWKKLLTRSVNYHAFYLFILSANLKKIVKTLNDIQYIV